MSDIVFNNGINIAGGGNTALNGLITDIVSEMDLQLEYGDLRDSMKITETRALSQDQKFQGYAGAFEIDPIVENGIKPEGERLILPSKGFQIQEYGQKYTTSFLMSQWLQKSETLQGADSSVKAEWQTLYNNAKYLLKGAMLQRNINMVNLWYKGFSISSAYGPGSATPKGQPLFSAAHPVRNGALTFRNILTTPNQALSVASLQDALNIIKTEVKLENGYKVKPPMQGYTLYVGMDLAVTARQILNEYGTLIQYSGVGTNANQANQFAFKGNKVTIKEVPLFGDLDKNGQQIGLESMWFLVNEEMMGMSRAQRFVTLYDMIIKNYPNNETDAYIMDIRDAFTVDHYGAEAYIVGSLGNA